MSRNNVYYLPKMTKKDFLQLGLLPAIILGFLGFSSAIQLVTFLSSLMDFKFSVMSIVKLDSFRLSIAGLFAICPLIALALYYLKFQKSISLQPITVYLRYMTYLLLGVILALTLNIIQVKLFRIKLAELSAEGANWTSFIEHLKPLSYGLTVLLIITATIFFTQKEKSK